MPFPDLTDYDAHCRTAQRVAEQFATAGPLRELAADYPSPDRTFHH
jgi:hypothetical protein